MRAPRNTAMEPTNLRRQRGAVLMVSLLILLLLTLLTLTAIQASTVQERLAGNARSLDLALQAAEASLREGEGRLESTVLPAADGTAGWYHHQLAPAPRWESPAAWSSNPRLAYAINTDDGWTVAAAPEFALEELPALPDPGGSLEAGGALPDDVMYRVSARGFGGTADTFVILQTTYRR